MESLIKNLNYQSDLKNILQLPKDCFLFRMKMSPVFTSGKLKNLFQLMLQSGEKMRDHLRDQIEESKIVPITVKDTFYKYTTDVISSVAFGIQANCFDTPPPEFYVNCKCVCVCIYIQNIQKEWNPL